MVVSSLVRGHYSQLTNSTFFNRLHMTDLEFFGTIGLFIAGFVLLIYLFTIRKKIMRTAIIIKAQAKAKIHYMSRPAVDPWAKQPGRQLKVGTPKAELNAPIIADAVEWGVDTYRERDIG